MMKNVLITGANKGIGLETAKQMAQLGYFVYLGSRDQARGESAVEQLNTLGFQQVELVVIDISQSESIQEAAKDMATRVNSLDVLINNAGITGDLPQNFAEVESSNLKTIFNTNFFGTVETTQAFLPLLKKSNQPVIVNVNSELGSLSLWKKYGEHPGYATYSAYGASKTAINAFTVMLSNELKDQNFRIVSASPGYTATDLNNHQGTKTVEEGASVIVQRAIAEDHYTGQFFTEEGETPW